MDLKNRMESLLEFADSMDEEGPTAEAVDEELEAFARHVWLGLPNAPHDPKEAVRYAAAMLKKLAADKSALARTCKLMSRSGKAVTAARTLAKDVAKRR